MKRARLAHLLAVLALGAAFLGALGPADHVSTTYSWPPKPLPDLRPSSTWYTPLLLIRRQPERLSARLPCRLPPALPRGSRPLTVLATVRFPDRTRGLLIRREGDRLAVRVGTELVTYVDLGTRPELDGGCEYRLSFGDGRWEVEGGARREVRGGELRFMPIVNGFFSSVDLRSGAPVSIEVVTAAHAFRTTALQFAAWTIAVVCGIASLLLVATGRLRWPRRTAAARVLRTAAASAHPADAVVAVVLLVWWVIAPAGFDDGWVVARQSMFSTAGGFSNYYDSLGANHPLGYWLEWTQHWLSQETAAMVVLRVPVLLCLAATWVLCRWALARALSPSARNPVALWALASAFLVGAFAGGMTLRPEPEVALLASGVLVCTMYFLERKTAAPIAIASILVGLAVTAHPAGIVSAAPLLVALPELFRWARSRISVAASIFTASGALVLVIAFVGSDLEQRRLDSQTIRVYGNANASWSEELTRYTGLSLEQYGSPLRRTAVAFLVLVVLAFLLRVRRERRPLLDLPAAGIGLALLLLTLTPSKWPWHFAALLGVGAVAVATESARLRDAARLSRGWSLRPFLVVGIAILAIAWSWTPRHVWNHLDVQTLEWTLGIERGALKLSTLAIALPVLLGVGLGLVEVAREGRGTLARVPWRIAYYTAPIIAAPLLAFTAGVFVTDAVRTDTWTLTRQNLHALGGDPDCGLAEHADVAVPASMRPLEASEGAFSGTTPSWVPRPPVDGLDRYTLGPVSPSSPAVTPWFNLVDRGQLGVLVAGRPDALSTLILQWGDMRSDRIEPLGRSVIRAVHVPELRSEHMYWRLFAERDLPDRPSGADRVRFGLRSEVPTGNAIAVSAVSYEDERLVRRFESGSQSLVAPNLLMYLPCTNLPGVHGGIFEVPDSIVALRDWEHPIFGRTTTPYAGTLDLYRLYRLPLTYSEDPPRSVVVYEFDERIPGAEQAPPEAATLTS